MNEFKDYTYESEDIILKRARKAVGLTIEDIFKLSNNDNTILNIKNKGSIGNLIESMWFGIKNNTSQLPDFKKANIELKIIPLTQKENGEYSIKERTKICYINYSNLIHECWESSSAKKKLNKILFIYYIHNKEDIKKSLIKKTDLFQLKGNDETILKTDWLKVQTYVNLGNAHLLSESISKALAASRSGQGGKNKNGKLKDLVSQPNSNIEALTRSFSLKQSFTNQRWNELNSGRYESILDSLNVSSLDFEDEIINRLRGLEGEKILDIADMFNIKISNGKNSVATIIKKAIGFKNVNSKIKEFEQLGITVKTISLEDLDIKGLGEKYYNLKLNEAISFPSFKLQEFVNEEFHERETEDGELIEQCTLLNELNRILFIPVYRNKSNKDDDKLGRAFFWSPSPKELEIIKKEWTMYRNEVAHGKAKVTRKYNNNGTFREINGFTNSKETQILHLRPHARDRSDRDIDHLGNSIVKQSFWLNKKFVHKLLKKVYELN